MHNSPDSKMRQEGELAVADNRKDGRRTPQRGRRSSSSPHVPDHTTVARRRRMRQEIEELRADLERQRARLDLLQRLTETDFLTGCLNRRGFDHAIAAALDHVRRYGTRICVVYLDLDRFKEVNDRWGHTAADRLLAALVGRIRSLLRPSDIIARLGGDEFAILAWHTDSERMRDRAAELKTAMDAAAMDVGLSPNAAGVSFGITDLMLGDTPSSVLSRADEGMYEQKRESRQRTAAPEESLQTH